MHSNPMEIIMSERIEHECSVSAIYWMDEAVAPEGDASSMVSNNNITPMLQQMLCDQQNRGQLAAGITTYDPDRPQILDTYKDVGSVNEVFRVSHPGEQESGIPDTRPADRKTRDTLSLLNGITDGSGNGSLLRLTALWQTILNFANSFFPNRVITLLLKATPKS